jgi:hypothetical protein
VRNFTKIEHVVENGRRYAIRNGRRFEIASELDLVLPKVKRKDFQPKFVQVPVRWVEALRQSKNAGAYQLALVILLEAFQRERIGGEIVLSSEMTGMSGTIRRRAAQELERLGLIQLERRGKQALRVILF